MSGDMPRSQIAAVLQAAVDSDQLVCGSGACAGSYSKSTPYSPRQPLQNFCNNAEEGQSQNTYR